VQLNDSAGVVTPLNGDEVMGKDPHPFAARVTYGAPTVGATVSSRPRIPFEGCPLCGGSNLKLWRTADCSPHPLYHPLVPRTMRWMRCGDCEHVFTDGYFSPEVMATVFERTLDDQKAGFAFEQQRFISARMVEKVARHATLGAWLDVGFGNASLLFTAQEWGFAPVGLDLRRDNVEALRKTGIEAHCQDLASLEGDARFAVISMADVLEHMPFPREGARAAHRLLKPRGILFVSMPHYDCAAWRLLDGANANPYWSELEHFHNFTRKRLYALLEETGFEPVAYGISERYRVCMEVIAKRAE
jgi:SAM-dependent methyltransferase